MRIHPAGLAVIALLGLALAVPRIAPTQGWGAGQGPRWDERAEQTFGPGRAVGRKLMTQEEWVEHRQKMQSLNPNERERYRAEWHTKMVERARERGITLPETPGPSRGPGRGWGMGPGNGRGQGPGCR
jgi:hypothetical protein